MIRRHTTPQGGFIALISAILIAAVLLILTFTTSTGTYFARYDSLGTEYRRISVGLSEACTNAALLKVAQNYSYTPPAGGDVVTVGPDTCRIKSVTYGAEDPVTHRKLATIQTNAQYPTSGGAWSNSQIKATILDPYVALVEPVPVCNVQATPVSVPANQTITVQWTASSNATSFALTPAPSPVIANPSEARSGLRTFSFATPGPVTFTGIATNAAGGSSLPCTADVMVTAPPPTPACADTVLMMDRTNSTSSYEPQMEAAADALLNLYKVLSPAPQVGVGEYGTLHPLTTSTIDRGKAEVMTGLESPYYGSGLLTDSYGSESMVTPNPVDVSLAPASEGNYKAWTKNGTTNAVTAVLSNDADTKYISESTSGDAHTFKVANAAVPAGATVNSVTLYVVAAKTSAVANPTIALRIEKGTGASNLRDDPTAYLLTDTNYSTLSWSMPNNPFTGMPWSLAEVNAWTTKFGVVKTTSSGTAKVTQLFVVVNYTGAAALVRTGLYRTINEIYAHGTSGGGSSNLSDGVRVGSLELNRTITVNGSPGHKSGYKKVLVFIADGKPDNPDNSIDRVLNEADIAKQSGVEVFSLYFGSATLSQRDLMAHLASGNVPVAGHQPGSKNDTGASTLQSVYDAENSDGDYFFIAPTADAMAGIVETIGRIVCPALNPACSNGIDDDGDGLVDSADPSCHVGDVLTGAYDPTDNNEWTPPPVPPPPATPPPPPPITIDSWEEVITPSI